MIIRSVLSLTKSNLIFFSQSNFFKAIFHVGSHLLFSSPSLFKRRNFSKRKKGKVRKIQKSHFGTVRGFFEIKCQKTLNRKPNFSLLHPSKQNEEERNFPTLQVFSPLPSRRMQISAHICPIEKRLGRKCRIGIEISLLCLIYSPNLKMKLIPSVVIELGFGLIRFVLNFFSIRLSLAYSVVINQ